MVVYLLLAVFLMVYFCLFVVDYFKIEVGEYIYIYFFDDLVKFIDQVKYVFDFIDDCLEIGKFCLIVYGVSFVFNGGNYFVDCLLSYFFFIFGVWGEFDFGVWFNKGGINIGYDVWIGWDVIILFGVMIGYGVIIVVKVVVVSDVVFYMIVGGNLVKLVCLCVFEDVCDCLLVLCWWDWLVEKIQCVLDVLMKLEIEVLECLV